MLRSGDHVKQLAANSVKGYFSNKFPYISEHNYTPDQKATLEKRFKKWSVMSSIATFMLLGFILPLTYSWIFYHAYLYIQNSTLAPGTIFFPIDWLAFCLPGLFASLATIIYPVEWLQRLALKQDFFLFADYYNDKNGCDNHEVALWIARRCIDPLLITLLFVSSARIIVYPEKFSVQMFYDLCSETHPLNTISKITYCANFPDNQGQKSGTPHYKIYFNDNSKFTTNWFFNSVEDAKPFIGILSKNRIVVDSVDIDLD